VAELGDKSQITAGLLAAQYAAIIPIFIGTLLALAFASAIMILLGRKIGNKLPLHRISQFVGVVFILFGAIRLLSYVTAI
jgi:Ca2+/H+ antiporter, TMEM165/GDT1 family